MSLVTGTKFFMGQEHVPMTRVSLSLSLSLCGSEVTRMRHVEMYTCSNTALGIFDYNFSLKHVCLTIRIKLCSPVRWHWLCIYVFSRQQSRSNFKLLMSKGRMGGGPKGSLCPWQWDSGIPSLTYGITTKEDVSNVPTPELSNPCGPQGCHTVRVIWWIHRLHQSINIHSIHSGPLFSSSYVSLHHTPGLVSTSDRLCHGVGICW
jgi:hypothetical protein